MTYTIGFIIELDGDVIYLNPKDWADGEPYIVMLLFTNRDSYDPPRPVFSLSVHSERTYENVLADPKTDTEKTYRTERGVSIKVTLKPPSDDGTEGSHHAIVKINSPSKLFRVI